VKDGLRAYFDLIYSELDCYATWLPGTRVAVGEIGRLSENGSFQHTGTLEGRGRPLPEVRHQPEPPQTVSTRGGVTFSAGGGVELDDAVQALARADAKLDINFTRSQAAALILQGIVRHEFADEQPVRAAMSSMLEDGSLQTDEVVVTYVLEARSGVVATTYDAQAGSDAHAGVAIGPGALTVANVDGHLRVVSQRSSQTVAQAERGRPLTPVYRALVLHRNRPWWRFWRTTLEIQPGFGVKTFADDAVADDLILGDRPSLAVPAGQSDGQSADIRG
jgi:hypothetical protein